MSAIGTATKRTTSVVARAGSAVGRAGGRVGGALTSIAYIIEHNRRRLIFLFGLLAFALLAWGAREMLEAALGMLAFAPILAIQLAFSFFFIIFQFVGLFWFLSRPRKYVVTPDSPQIDLSFENYRGQPDLLEHARSTVRILQGEKEFELRGGEMPKGLLLSGRPGTGKTFLASCIAAEAKLPFIYIDASSLSGMFFGMDVLMIIKLFRDARGLARKYAKPGQRGACIIFMDELDSIGYTRGGQGGGTMGMGMGGMMMGGRMGLNTMLNQMDSMGQHVEDRLKHKILRWLGFVRGPVPLKPVAFVIGATNRPEVLDPALTRPGRLDRVLEVHAPDAEGRRDIILHYLAKKAHDPDINIDLLVSDSINWTPIMIKTIINEALIKAHDDGRNQLSYRDWIAAADERELGLKQPIRDMLAEDRRALAYHEAGHAVVAHYLLPEDRIQKATIQRQGHALGFVSPHPREERHTRHARQIEAGIMVSLGSRAVEEMLLDTKLTGASSDLQNATANALTYCAIYGMGSTLLVMPPDGPLSFPLPVTKMADTLLEMLMEETKRLIREKEYAVHAIAQGLLERDELIGAELDAIFEAADAANPDKAGPFERKLVSLPRLFKSEIEQDTDSELLKRAAASGTAAALGAASLSGPSPLTAGWAGRAPDDAVADAGDRALMKAMRAEAPRTDPR